ncbi:MAG TPA: hypothetical protein VGX68_11115 [Thermoanaerobaculia bacterium]|jgi:hypothetical protein|nr:hypothetical protein [Thermoanaerobaculia bacterium]
MRAKVATVPFLIVLLSWSAALAAGQESDSVVAKLRAEGPAGMEAAIARGFSGDLLDQVCGVRDCAAIRLFWYTDLEAAKAAARESGKPILSLRLMGRLDEEFSCANSRFFRTAFYKNHEINALLRDRFILHWRSVRPVPRVTIDFGDGRRLERTLTGNSIHYVLDSRGRLVAALPGLFGPEKFQSMLEEAANQARYAEDLDDTRFAEWLNDRFPRQLRIREAALLTETSVAGMRTDRPCTDCRDTASKMVVEQPILRAIMDEADKAAPAPELPRELANLNDEKLQKVADFRRDFVHLDAESRAFLLRKQGIEDPQDADRTVASFEKTMALDEVINEYRTGPAILLKLSDPEVLKDFDLEAFNLWVYEKVFRTPLSDPWLGLAPEDVYSGLPAATKTSPAPQPWG